MAKRIILGGVLGGIALFVWGALSTWFSSSATLGFSSLPSEEAALPALRAAVKEPGLYFFPGYDMKAMRALPKEQAEAANSMDREMESRAARPADHSSGDDKRRTMAGQRWGANSAPMPAPACWWRF